MKHFSLRMRHSNTEGTWHLEIMGNQMRLQQTKSNRRGIGKGGEQIRQWSQSLPPQKTTFYKTAKISAAEQAALQDLIRHSGFLSGREKDGGRFCYGTSIEVAWGEKVHTREHRDMPPSSAYVVLAKRLEALSRKYFGRLPGNA